MEKHEPKTITPHFYQLGTPFFPAYLSVGEDAMLIEGGTGATSEIIVSQTRDLGIEPGRIKYIALTHTHGDHIGALPYLKSLWPHLKVIGGKRAPKFLESEKMKDHFFWLDDSISQIMKGKGEIAQLPEKLREYEFHVDIVVEEGQSVDLGSGVVWTAYNTPGHSNCHVSWRETHEEILIIGDAIGFHNPRENAFWPNYFVSLSDYCKSIRKLGGLSAKKAALSHNGVINSDVKKFLQRAMAATEAYHLEMIERSSKGEDPKAIALEKANWVNSIADHMPFRIMEPMCRLLINHSLSEAGNPELSFEL